MTHSSCGLFRSTFVSLTRAAPALYVLLPVSNVALFDPLIAPTNDYPASPSHPADAIQDGCVIPHYGALYLPASPDPRTRSEGESESFTICHVLGGMEDCYELSCASACHPTRQTSSASPPRSAFHPCTAGFFLSFTAFFLLSFTTYSTCPSNWR